MTEPGSNFPPKDLLLGDALRARLRDEHLGLLDRVDALVAASLRVPPIVDEDIARKVADFVRQVAACIKAAQVERVGEKEPYLEGGRAIDGFFAVPIGVLEAIKAKQTADLTKYQQAKEAAERARREAEADEARRQADEKLKAARDEASLTAAIMAEQEADKRAREAIAKPADLSRTRGDLGAVASLRTEWVFADLDRADLDLEALRDHLPADGLERAVRSYIKAGGRQLRGVRIYESTSAVVR